MKLRVGPELMTLMQKAQRVYEVRYSDMAVKALNKARRVRPDLSGVDAGSTYKGQAIRLQLLPGQEPDQEYLRKVLKWYLDQHSYKVEPVPESDLIEGIDYTIKEIKD